MDYYNEHDKFAAAWLRELIADVLADGQLPAKDVDRQAREAGFTKKQVWTAKTRLGVKSAKSAMGGGWFWSLPKIPFTPEDSQDSPSINEGIFGEKGNLRDENEVTELEL